MQLVSEGKLKNTIFFKENSRTFQNNFYPENLLASVPIGHTTNNFFLKKSYNFAGKKLLDLLYSKLQFFAVQITKGFTTEIFSISLNIQIAIKYKESISSAAKKVKIKHKNMKANWGKVTA